MEINHDLKNIITAPPGLKKGDRVGILSTARKVDEEIVKLCESVIESWGFVPVRSHHLLDADNQFAGSDQVRMAALQDMMDDSTLSAILCARGGYGTLRIIDGIRWDSFLNRPKWIIGFSDVTPLLNECANMGIQSIHGPMAISFKGGTGDAQSLEYLRRILSGENSIVYSYTPPSEELVRPGSAEGILLGGNLSLLSHMIGTRSDIDTRGRILFFEDVDEYLYSLDRLVLHLKRAGKLEGLRGLIVGGMSDVKDNDTPFGMTAEQIAFRYVNGYSYPFASSFPSGHIPTNYPLVIGREVGLKVTHTQVSLIQ